MRQQIEQLFAGLEQAGFEIIEFDLSDPLKSVPAEIDGIPLPDPLAAVYRSEFGHVTGRYVRDLTKAERKPFGSSLGAGTVYGGPSLLSPDGMREWREAALDHAAVVFEDEPEELAWWLESVPFCWIECGDFLAFDEHGQIVYLCHDGESMMIEADFAEFWAKWQRLHFIGPEWWMLEPFLSEHGLLVGNLENTARFRDGFERLLSGRAN